MPDLIDLLAEQALNGQISWQQADAALRALETEPPPDFTRTQEIYERLGGAHRVAWPAVLEALRKRQPEPVRTTQEEFRAALPPDPDWWAGASAEEVLDFDFYPGGPNGSDLSTISDDELGHRLVVAQRLASTEHRSRWLDGYVPKLLVERRRRRGAA